MNKKILGISVIFVIVIVFLISIFVLSLIALFPHFGQPLEISHHGSIEGKFTAIDSGTTTYHLLVNESGTVIDIQTDSVT